MICRASEISGVLLAGGLARRMGGGDKCLKTLGGKPLLEHVLSRVSAQVGPLIINANGDPARFKRYGLPIIPDVVSGHVGPLAGIHAGMQWVATSMPNCNWMVSFATDSPFLPLNLVELLSRSMDGDKKKIVCASSNGRKHPVFALWPVALRNDLRDAIMLEGMRKIDMWTKRYSTTIVDFDSTKIDPFFNVNSPDDFNAAETIFQNIT